MQGSGAEKRAAGAAEKEVGLNNLGAGHIILEEEPLLAGSCHFLPFRSKNVSLWYLSQAAKAKGHAEGCSRLADRRCQEECWPADWQ